MLCMCRFQRMFVSVKVVLDLALACGMQFSAVDGTFCKHTQYKSGVIHMITTRDGNNEIMPLAWAVCETESGPTYKYFASQCKKYGLDQYLDNKESILYSDRDKGLEEFHNAFPECRVARCFLRHHMHFFCYLGTVPI